MYAYLSDGRAAAERRHGGARHLTAVLIDPPDRGWQSAPGSVLTHILTGAMSRAGALNRSLKAAVAVCMFPRRDQWDHSPHDLLNPKQGTWEKSPENMFQKLRLVGVSPIVRVTHSFGVLARFCSRGPRLLAQKHPAPRKLAWVS